MRPVPREPGAAQDQRQQHPPHGALGPPRCRPPSALRLVTRRETSPGASSLVRLDRGGASGIGGKPPTTTEPLAIKGSDHLRPAPEIHKDAARTWGWRATWWRRRCCRRRPPSSGFAERSTSSAARRAPAVVPTRRSGESGRSRSPPARSVRRSGGPRTTRSSGSVPRATGSPRAAVPSRPTASTPTPLRGAC